LFCGENPISDAAICRLLSVACSRAISRFTFEKRSANLAPACADS